MSCRIPYWLLAGLFCSLATSSAQTQSQDRPPASFPRTERATGGDDAIEVLRKELAKLQAKVERLQRESARAKEAENESGLQLLKSAIGEPAQTTNLRPGEAMRFTWRDERVWWPAISPDGRWGFVSGRAGVTPRLLDLHAGVERLFVKSTGLMSIRGFFSPDSRLVGLCYAGGEIEIFDLKEGKRRSAFRVHSRKSGLVGPAAFTPDGKQIIAAAGDSIALIDVDQGQEVRRVSTGTELVNFTMLSGDGKFLACAGGSFNNTQVPLSDTIRVFDATTEDVLFRVTPKVRTSGGYCSILPDNKHVLALQSSRLSLFTIAGNKEVLHFPVAGGIRAVALSADGRFAAIVGYDKGVQIWDVKTARLRHVFVAENPGFEGVAWSKDGKRLLTASYDGTARLWNVPELPAQESSELPPPATVPDVRSAVAPQSFGVRRVTPTPLPERLEGLERDESSRIPAGQSGVHTLIWLPDGKQIIAVGKGGPRLHDLKTRQSAAIRAADDEEQTSIQSLAASPDGRWVVFGDSAPDGPARLTIWDLPRREEMRRLEGHNSAVQVVAISPDGKAIASASEDKSILIWNVESGKVLHTLRDYHHVQKLVFSPDGKQLVSLGSSGGANFWDLEAGKLHHHTSGPGKTATIAFAADGKSLFSSFIGPSHAATHIEMNPGSILQQWTGRGTGAMALSPDGVNLAIGSSDDDEQIVYVWQIAKSRFIATFRSGEGRSIAMAFSPDGKKLVTGGTDEYLQLWDVPENAGH